MSASLKTTLFFIFIGFFNPSFSQVSNNYISSEQLIKIGDSLLFSEQYNAAVVSYKKVFSGDHNYTKAILGIMNSYKKLDNFKQTEYYALKGIKLNNEQSINHYLALGHSYKENDKLDQSILVLTDGIKAYPMNSKLYYLRSKAHQKNKNLELAILDLQSSLVRNPNYSEAHLDIAKLAQEQNHITQSILAYNSYLILCDTPEENLINDLNQYFSFNTELTLSESSISKNNYFELDQLIKSGTALEIKLEVNKSLSQPFVKQSIGLFKQLHTLTLTTDFWDTFYVPFYNELAKKEQLNNLIYYLYRNDSNSKTVKIINKNSEQINHFDLYLEDNWLKGHNTFIESKDVKQLFWSNSKTIASIGKMVDDEITGAFNYYYQNGRLSQTGHFDKDGERIKTWYFYHQNGNTHIIKHYEDGDNFGTDSIFYPNQTLEHTYTYTDGQLNGPSIWRYSNGVIRKSENYQNNQLNGLVEEFYITGGIQKRYSFKDNLKSDSIILFDENGTIIKKQTKQENIPNGMFQSYHPNKQLLTEGFYENQKKQGLWKNYFNDGTLHESCFYSNDLKNGPQYQYFQHSDKHITYWYSNGFLDAFELHQEDSNELPMLQHVGTDSTTFKVFDDNKVLLIELNTKSNTLHGPYKEYFLDGKINIKGAYWNRKKHGEWLTYFENGKISNSKTYYFGKPTGTWIDYNSDGSVINQTQHNKP